MGRFASTHGNDGAPIDNSERGPFGEFTPLKKYGVIYADPPWKFKFFSKKGEGRNAVSHYPCMSVEEICALPVQNFAAKDCILLLWVTDPFLPRAIEVMKAWGFEYKTEGFCWIKTNNNADLDHLSEKDFFFGLGYWTRANPERCLLATRGKPKCLAHDVRRLVIAPRREHSRKPYEIYERIERFANGPFLELFARETRPGWDTWGNQQGLFDDGAVEARRRPSSFSQETSSQGQLPFNLD